MTVVEVESGAKLTGDDAPRQSELEAWLQEHPGYKAVDSDKEEEEGAESGSDVSER